MSSLHEVMVNKNGDKCVNDLPNDYEFGSMILILTPEEVKRLDEIFVEHGWASAVNSVVTVSKLSLEFIDILHPKEV